MYVSELILNEGASTYSGLIPPQREQAALRAIEEQHEREEKRREQEATKVALDRSLKLKLRRKVSGCAVRGHCILHMEHLKMHTDVSIPKGHNSTYSLGHCR